MAELWINKHSNIDQVAKHRLFRNGLPNCLCYIRVSTPWQVHQGYSMEGQENFLRQYLDTKFGIGKYNALWIDDGGLSGTRSFDRSRNRESEIRPGLAMAADMCDQKLFGYFVVLDIDRLARETLVYLQFCEYYLVKSGAWLISAMDGYESESGGRDYVLEQKAIYAAEFSRKLSKRVKIAMADRAKDGYLCGRCVYGWEFDDRPTLSRGKRAGSNRVGIRIVKKEALIVRQMYDWYLSGHSAYWIKAELERQGILSPLGKSIWRISTILGILDHPVHCGLLRQGDKLVKGVHFDQERIIDDDVYYRYLSVRKHVERKESSVGPKSNCFLGTLARCALCGSTMHFSAGSNSKPRYKCLGTKDGKHEHDAFSMALDAVESRVIERLAELAADPRNLSLARERLQERLDEEEALLEEQEQAELEELEALNREKAELILQFRQKALRLSQDDYDLVLEGVENDLKRAENRLAEIRARSGQRDLRENRLKMALGMLRSFSAWDSMSPDQRQRLVSLVVESVLFEPQRGHADMHLKLIFRETQVIAIPYRGNGIRQREGLERIAPTELTSAYYWLKGHTDRQISVERELAIDTVYIHRQRLIKHTGAKTFEEALEIVKPLLESRKGELLLGTARARSVKRRFTRIDSQLLDYIAKGLSNREIAEVTGKSPATIATQRARLYDRLGVTNARDAIRKGRVRGLISGAHAQDVPTPKEAEALRAANCGCKQRIAAKRIGISEAAFKQRIKGMFRRYGFNRISQLLNCAREKGWIDEIK
ncbi:MAG: LuxR C-terminal-related transcriptional regulator [Armatimonadota bacterium]|nr:LuxR C-terminal-related transcriptional regulator [bacterium]